VQIDGSEHWWFEDRGPQSTLLVYVDDATSRVSIDPVHRLVSQHTGFADRRAEEGGLAVLADPGRGEILIDELLEFVVPRHLMALAPFLVQPHTP
jgi:hypothetical protein